MTRPTTDAVAIILATGISVALLGLTSAAVYGMTTNSTAIEPARLVAVTQVLTGWGGGMIGVLGAYVGYTFTKKPPEE